MAIKKGKCVNIDCEHYKQIIEIQAGEDFVCPYCQQQLEILEEKSTKTKGKAGGVNAKLIAMIAAGVLLLGGIVASLMIFVFPNKDSQEPPANQPNLLSVKPDSSSLQIGETVKLSPQFDMESDTVRVQWGSTEPSIASVSTEGVVTAKKEGTVTITCTHNGTEVFATIMVKNLVPSVQPKLLSVTPNSSTLKIGETVKLSPQFDMESDTVRVQWSSSEPSIASVSTEGIVTAKKEGTVTITCSQNGAEVNASIMVKASTSTNRGPKVSWGRYSGPDNGLGGTIYVTMSYSLSLNNYSGDALELSPGDEIQQTKFQNGQLRQGVWIHNGSRRFFTR